MLSQLNRLFRNKELSFGYDIQPLEFDTDMQTYILYSRGPNPLLGTGPHSRRWVVGSKASSAAPHCLRYHLNHPPQPLSMEKLPSTKPVPGAKKVGDHWYTVQVYLVLLRFALLQFLQIVALWQACMEQVYWRHFSNSIIF